ncbi:MAG: MFS transporter [Gammaproteobacteria bacterium 39-13]|nr:MFS transporter [Gammaproteobacteria bacterium]OJV87337.1 MAG: MFS transporter [Gammaproteobacteria bacterium 39-13]
MWIDLSPLFKNRDFRYLYFGQFVSFFGTMLSLVALPYQVYQLTGSTFAVGILGVIELVPLLFTAFIGGALADVMDRKKLLIMSEIGMALGCLVLIANAILPQPHLWLIYVIAGGLSGLSGLHRPSLDATIPRLVSHEEIQSASILASLKGTVGMIGGPAAAGLCISYFGLPWTYALDFATFAFSIVALMQIRSLAPSEARERPSLKSIKEALNYAMSRHELLGTYLVDFAAMVFAMPNALFPAMSVTFGGTKILGWLYAAPAVGALIVTVFSGWSHKIKRHGMAVIIAASLWGTSMACVGLSYTLWGVLFFLALAGAADGVSGIFRVTIWNETIPDRIRGRMASLEMISYMSGPLLGNTFAGFLASVTSTQIAITSGGSLCVLGVFLSALLLPGFWKYHKIQKTSA